MSHVVEVEEVFGNHVDSPQTRVRVRSRERHERVGQVVGRDGVRESGREDRLGSERPIPIAHHALHDEHGIVIGRRPGNSFDCDRDVASGHRVVSDLDF